MATTLQIGAVAQITKVQFDSMTLKLNTLDCVLVDPATIPALGDAVTMTNPAWTGTVIKVGKRDIVDKAGSHIYVTIGATNAVVAGASAGPFGLSDAPNGSTTFGFSGLQTENTQNADGTTTAHGQCTINQAGLWPAMTFTLTSAGQGFSATNFSVVDVTVTWQGKDNVPQYLIEFGDPLVTMSVWANSSAAGVLPITTTKITDGAVTTPKVAAGAITADLLAAQLVLASLIATPALTGQRLELDQDGLRSIASDDTLEVNIPTDGSPVSVTGQIQASSLVSTGSSEFDGINLFATNSSTTLAAGVQAPSAAPTLTSGWNTHTPATPSVPSAGYTIDRINQCKYDAAGGASGATACMISVIQWIKSGNPNIYQVVEWKISDWSVDRATTLTGLTMGADFAPLGVCRLGTSWYMIAQDVSSTTTYRVTKITRSTGAQSATATRVSAMSDITTDGTNLLIGTQNASATVETWTTAPAFSATKTLTGLTGLNTTRFLNALEWDGSAWWVNSQDQTASPFPVRAYKFTPATGALVANSDFPAATTASQTRFDLWWDGTVFHSNGGHINVPVVYDHTSWDWTTASAVYWVGYAWYDNAGTTHETTIGPRNSITMDRRMRLSVSNATIPVGGADDPNHVRVYMAPNATDPGAGNFKRQVDDAATQRYLTTYNAAGGADGAGTAFPGGVGGTIASTGAGWTLRGNGSTQFGGASFPPLAATGDHYYRTDRLLWFYFDGTNWLSSSLYILEFAYQGIAATSTILTFAPPQWAGSDIWLETSRSTFLVSGGGSALSGSHSWIGTVNKRPTGNTQTSLGTHTINSGSSAVWRTDDIAIGALLAAGTTYFAFDIAWVKTGTPGALNGFEILTYRLVAT
jgi:hypothetical protein